MGHGNDMQVHFTLERCPFCKSTAQTYSATQLSVRLGSCWENQRNGNSGRRPSSQWLTWRQLLELALCVGSTSSSELPIDHLKPLLMQAQFERISKHSAFLKAHSLAFLSVGIKHFSGRKSRRWLMTTYQKKISNREGCYLFSEGEFGFAG